MASKGVRAFFIFVAIAAIFFLVEKSQTKTVPEAPKPTVRFDPLSDIAVKYKSDKWHTYFYTPIYHQYFKDLKGKKISLLELGAPNEATLRLWHDYFPKGTIVGTAQKKVKATAKRIHTYQGHQTDTDFLKKINRQHGAFDIIIDGNHHTSGECIQSFETLFPLLKEGGIYVIEDTQTSYWKDRGGVINPHDPATTINHFKALTDGLNFSEIKQVDKNYLPSYTDQHIRSIHFYHNLIVVLKGKNDIPSSRNHDALKAYEKSIDKHA